MHRESSELVVPVALAMLAMAAAGTLGYLWYTNSLPEPAPDPVELPMPSSPEPVAEQPSEPILPAEDTGSNDDEPEPVIEAVPLPTLAESDQELTAELNDLFGDSFGTLLAGSGIIERIVATVDNLPRDTVAERVRPLKPPGGAFEVDGQHGNDNYRLSSSNYSRYSAMLQQLEAADVDSIAALYRQYYPLFQTAYVDLGYPNDDFNDRLVEVIDHLLDTPEPEQPLELVRPHVLYEYKNPEFEALSAGQKLLLRMGSGHASTAKEKLRALRVRIAKESTLDNR